jgi:hypothetical protein
VETGPPALPLWFSSSSRKDLLDLLGVLFVRTSSFGISSRHLTPRLRRPDTELTLVLLQLGDLGIELIQSDPDETDRIGVYQLGQHPLLIHPHLLDLDQ